MIERSLPFEFADAASDEDVAVEVVMRRPSCMPSRSLMFSLFENSSLPCSV